ncbi:hypothetical protein [Ralstonia pseudosolanacearum]|uniref:hypothetical protein n=1 Tax=Ralstonia pseudosolanacearum TaxID=1310165 RepID=UPI000B5F8308|nr:hypothetical protein [Ralstonia pseudosolanacearum]ASL74325.1 hypothetical protein BC350_12395 [Ralstonia pseudosolanacearum]
MLQFSDLNPELLNLEDDPLVFRATLNAHGLYSTENFVLRLSPRVHELMDAFLHGETDGLDRAEIVQAYSTYLHETLHWWQHVGSSAGLILSLAYPAQVLGSMEFARSFGQIVGAVKPMKAWALRAELDGKTHEDPALQAANIAVNNTLDISYYKQIAFNPQRAKELARSTPYFESVGHSYLKAYGDVLGAINGSCDFPNDEFPDPTRWEPEWDRLRRERCDGFVHGSMPPLAKVGLFAIFEGQARFSQIQFLASSGGRRYFWHIGRMVTPTYTHTSRGVTDGRNYLEERRGLKLALPPRPAPDRDATNNEPQSMVRKTAGSPGASER